MALKNVSSYIKNLGKSVKYAAADEFEKRMPATSEFMQTNQEVFQTVYKGFSDIKGSFSLVKRKVEKSKFYEAADVGLKAIMEDLKTGQFYNTTREGEMSVKAMGIDLSDMGDEDFNFDDFGSFDDDTSNSKESKPKSTGVSVIQSSSRQSAELVSDTIARTGSAIVESNKASTSVLYQQNLGLMSQIHSGIFSMSKMMNDNFSVIGGNFKTYAENSTKFYESVTNNTNEIKAMLGELLEMERNRYSTAQQEEKDGKSKKISYGDIVGSNGTPDLKAYFGRIMQNTKSVGGAFSILDSFEGNALAAMVASPLKFIPEAVVKAVIPATVGYAAEELDKSIGGIFANLIGKFNEMSTSENNVLSTIGKLFGVKSSLKSLKPTKIDANPVPFDNVVREAIVTEIPTYLRKILSYISGEEEMIFNRDSGQFVTGKELQKQLENVELSNISSAFSDFNEEMDKLIAKIQFATGEDRKQFDKTRKKINTAQFRKGFVGNMQNMDFEKAAELYGLSYEDEAAFYVFKNLFKNISKSNTMQLAGNIMSSRENYNRSMDDLQSRGVYGALSNNSNVGQFVNYDKYGNNLSKDIKGFGKDGKGPGPLGYDKLGHDIFFYLQNMLSELINIRNGLGYIGIKKGKGGKSGTPVNIPFGTVSSNIAKDENFIDPTSKSRKRERDALDKETAKYKRLNDPNNNERYKKNIILLDYDAEDSSKLEGHIQGKLDNVFMTLATQKIAEDRFENFKADNRYKDLSGAIVKKLDEIALEADKKINSKEEFNVEPTKEDMKDDEDEKKKKQFKDPKELLKAASEIVKKPSKWVTDLLVSTEGRIYNLFFGKSQKLDETGKPIEGLGERIAYEFRQTWNKVSETFQEKFLDPLREKLGLDEDESIFRGIARKLGLEDSIYGEDGIWTKTKDKLGAVGKWVMDQLEGTYKDVKKLVNPDAVSEEAEASATAVEDIRKDLSDLNDQYAFTQESVINSIRDMARYDKENYEKLVNDAYGKQEEASKKQYEDQMNMLKDANNEVVQKLIDNQKDYLKKDESGKVILDEESMKDLAKMFGQDDDSEDAKFVRTWITDMEKFRKQYEKDKLARENMLNINENKEAYDEFNSEETQKRYNILSKKNADNKLTVGEYEEFKNLNLMGAKSKGYLAAKQDIDSGRFGESVVVQNAMIDDNKFGNLARRYRGESPIKYDELAEKYKEVTVKKAKRLSTKLDKLKEDLKNASDSESRSAINEQIANVSEEYFNLLETNGYAAFIEREDKRKRIDEKKKELERAEIKRKAEENIDMMVKYGGKDFATYVSSIRSIKSMANRLGIKIDDSDFSDPDKTKKTVQRIVKDSLNLKNQGKISNEAFTNIAGARDQIYGGEDSLDSRIRENSNQEIGEILNKQHIWDRMGIDIGESDSEKKANKKKNRQTAISKMLYEKFGGNVMSLDDKSIFDMFKDYTDKDEDTLKEKGLSWKFVKKIQDSFAPRESKDKGSTDKGGDSSDDSDDAESHAYGGRVGDMVPVTLAKGEKANGKLVEQGGFGFLKKGTKITPNKKSQRPFDAIQEKIDLFKGKMFKIKGYADGGTVDADGNVTMDDSLYEEQMQFTDQANQEYTAPKKFKSKINPDDTLVGQTIDTAKQGVNAVFNALFDPGDDEKLKDAARDVFKNIKEYAPSALAGGIVGGGIGLLVGGPLLAASAGAAIGIAKSSDKVKNWLFGDIGEDGERQGGIISKDVQQTLKQYIPDMSKYGVTGAVAGLLTPFGPVGGLMIGSAIGWAKNNAEIRQALFGDEDGLLNKERREKIKKAFPNIAIATLGTVLAGPFGGILPNAVLGAGLGLVSTTDSFKDAIFGKEDENGERHGGLLGAVKDYVIEPMKEFATNLKDRVTEFVIEHMIDPLKSAIVPIAKQGSVIVKTIFSSAGRAIGWIFDKTMASPLGIFFKEHIIEPGSKIVKKLFNAVMAPAKLALTAPFKAVGYIGDRLRNRQINKGNANYMTAQERIEYRDTHPNRKTVGIFGKKDKYEEADELLANMDLEQLQDLQENIEMSQLGDKTIRKKTRDLKSDIVTAVDEFFDNSSRDRLGIPLISKTQRNRLVKLIQSGNSAKAMTLLNSLKGRDGQKVDRSEAEKLIGQFQEQGKSIRNLKANRKAWDITRKKSKSVLKDYGFKDLSGDYLSRLRDYVNTEITDRKNSNMGKNTDGANGLSGDFFQDVTEKNTDRLIQAINELNDTQTLILEGVNKGEYGGTGNEKYDNKIRKRLAANDLKDITAKEKTLAVFDKMEDKIKNVLVELVGFSEDELKDIDRDSLTNEALIKFLKPFIMDGTAAANKDLVKYFFSKQGKKVHKDGKLLKRTQALWKKDKNISSQDLEKTFGLTQRQFGRVIGNMDSMNMYAADVDDKIAQGFANRNGFNLSDITDSIKRSDEYKKFANDYKSSISYDENKFNSVASDLKWNNAASEAWKDAPSSMVKKNVTIFNAPFKAAKTTGGILGSLGGSLGRAWKRNTSKTYNSGVSSIIKKDPKFFELLEKSGIIKDLTNVRATQLKNFLKDKRQWSKEANDIISGKTTLDEVLSKFNSHAEGGIVGDETYGVFSPDDDEYATDENLKAFQDGILSQIAKLDIKSYAEGGEVDDDTEEDEKETNENKKESVLSRLLNKIKRSDKKDKAEDKEKPEKKEARTFVERQFVPETGTYKQFLVKEGTDESSPAKIQELNTSDTEKTNKLMEMKTSKLGELFGGIKNAVGSVGTWLQGAIIPDNREDKFGTLKRWLGKAFLGATALGAIPHIVNFYNEKFVPTLKSFWNETVTPWANEHIKPFWENVVMPKFGGVVNKVVEKLDMAVNFIRTLPERIGQFTTGTLLPWFSGDKDTIEVFGLKVPSFPRLITEKIIPYYVGGFSFLLSDIVPAFVKAFTKTLPSLLNAAFQGFREIMSIDLTDLFSSGGSKRHSTMEKENPSNDKVDDVVLEYGKYSAPFKDKLKTKGDNSRAIQENKSGMSLSGKSILSNANKGSTVINNYSGTSGGSLDSGYGDIPEDEYTDPNLVNPYTGITINQQEREDNIEFKENTHTTLGDALLYGLGRNFLTGGQYGKGVGKVFGTVGDMVSRIPFIGKPLGGMIKGAGNVFDFTGQAGKNMYSVLGNGISNGASALKNGISNLGTGIKNIPSNVSNVVGNVGTGIKNIPGNIKKEAGYIKRLASKDAINARKTYKNAGKISDLFLSGGVDPTNFKNTADLAIKYSDNSFLPYIASNGDRLYERIASGEGQDIIYQLAMQARNNDSTAKLLLESMGVDEKQIKKLLDTRSITDKGKDAISDIKLKKSNFSTEFASRQNLRQLDPDVFKKLSGEDANKVIELLNSGSVNEAGDILYKNGINADDLKSITNRGGNLSELKANKRLNKKVSKASNLLQSQGISYDKFNEFMNNNFIGDGSKRVSYDLNLSKNTLDSLSSSEDFYKKLVSGQGGDAIADIINASKNIDDGKFASEMLSSLGLDDKQIKNLMDNRSLGQKSKDAVSSGISTIKNTLSRDNKFYRRSDKISQLLASQGSIDPTKFKDTVNNILKSDSDVAKVLKNKGNADELYKRLALGNGAQEIYDLALTAQGSGDDKAVRELFESLGMNDKQIKSLLDGRSALDKVKDGLSGVKNAATDRIDNAKQLLSKEGRNARRLTKNSNKIAKNLSSQGVSAANLNDFIGNISNAVANNDDNVLRYIQNMSDDTLSSLTGSGEDLYKKIASGQGGSIIEDFTRIAKETGDDKVARELFESLGMDDKQIKKLFNDKTFLQRGKDAVKEGLTNAKDSIAYSASFQVDKAKNLVKNGMQRGAEGLNNFKNNAKKLGTTIAENVSSAVDGILKPIKGLGSTISKAFTDYIITPLKGVGTGIAKFASGLGESLSNFISEKVTPKASKVLDAATSAKNAVKGGVENVADAVKVKGGVVSDIIDSAKSVLGSGSKKAASEAAEEVVEETVEKTGKEALEAAGGKGIIGKITSWISDGITKIAKNGKVLDKIGAAAAEKGGKEAVQKAQKKFTENITKKFLPKLIGEITSRCKKVTAKITAKFAAVIGSGGIASIGFAVMDFISGYSHAASILGVDKPDFSMKCIAGMYNMLKGFFMLTALIPDEIVMNLVINYIAPALNIDTTEWEKERNEAEEAAQKYNIENGFAHMETRIDEETGEEYQEYVVDDEKAALSTSDYLEKNNQNAFTKFTGAVGKAAKGVGGLLKDNVKGAGTGAAVGTAIGAAIGTLIPIPGVGTAIGAAVGGTLGTVAGAGIQALTKNSEGVAYYPVDGNGSYYVIENQKTVKAYSATGEYLNDVDLSPDVIYQGVQEGTILTGEKVVVKSKAGQFFDAWQSNYEKFEENHKVLSTLVNASGVGLVIKAVPKIANFFRAKSAIPYYLIPTSETLDPSKVPYLVVDGEKVRCFNPNGEEEEGFSLRKVFNTTTQGEKKDSKYLATATDKQLLQELIASGSVTAGEEPVKFEKSGLGKTLDKAKNMFNNVKDTITNSVNMSNEEFSKFIANKGAFGKGFAILSRGIGKLAGKIGGALKSFFTSEKITGYRYVDGNGSLYCIKDDGTVEVYNANGEKITDSKESPDAVASADEIYQLYVAGLMEEGEIVIRQSGIGKLWDKFSGKVSELWNSGKEYLGKTFEENGILGGAFKILGDGFDVALGFFGKDRKVAAGKAYVDAEGCFYAEDKTPGKYSKYNTEGRLIGEGGEYTAEELDALFQKGVLDISDEPLEIKRDSFITNTVNWVKEKGAALWDKGKEFLGSLADKYGDKAKEIGNKIGKSITNFVFGTETKTCYTTPEGDYYVPAGENVWQHYTQAGDLINTVTDADSSEAIQANINAGVYVKGTVEQPKAATFRNFLGSMGGKLKGLWSSATSLAGDAFEGLKSGAKKLGKILFGEDFGEPKKVTGWFDTDNSYYVKRSSSCFEHYSAQGTLIETITDQEACDCIQRNFNAGMYTEKEIPDPYQSVASKLIDGVKEKLGDAWEGAVSAAKAGWDWVKNTATDFWNWLTGDEEDPDDVYENAYIDEDGNVYAKGSGKPPEYTQYTPQGSIVKKLKWKKIKKLLSKGKIVKAEDNIVSEVKAREGAALGKAMSVYNEAAKKFDETADSNTSGLGKLFKGLFSDDDDSGSGKGKYGRGKYLRAKYGLGNNVIIVNESNIIGESTSNNHAIMAREIADNPQLEKEIRAKYGMANGKYSTMMDYNGVPYNAPGDTIRQTIGDSGCGIVAGVNAVNSINGATAVNVKDAAKMAIKEGYKEKNGGTKPGFFKKLFRDNGISSSMSGNKTTLENNLKNGETTVLMGINKNSGVRTPYGSKTPHYVLATGVDNSGKLIVQDPQDRRSNLKYNLRDVLSKTEFGVSTGTSLYGTGDNGFEYNDDPNMINFGTGGIMSNPEDYINEYSGAAFKFFKENGFSDAAAVGIIANAWQESSCNPKAIQGNGKGPAAGFFQWENYSTKSSRWKSLNDYATKKGKEWTDFQSQMEYALQEIDGLGYYFKKHGSTVEGFKNMTDPKEATLLFEQAFERAGKPNMEARYAAAEAYWDKYAGTNGTSLSSSSSSSSDSDSEDSSSSKEDSSLIGKALAPISTITEKISSEVSNLTTSASKAFIDDVFGETLLAELGIGTQSEPASEESSDSSSSSGGGIPADTADAKQEWAYYAQGDSRWGSKPYSEGTYASSACGPTSMAMILTGLLGNRYYPTEFPPKYGTKVGTTTWDGFKTVANDYGLTVASQTNKPGDWSKYKSEIDAGHPFIFSGNKKASGSVFTTGGHFVVSQGYIAENGQIKGIIINDPAGKSNVYTNLDQLNNEIKQLWSFGVQDTSHPAPASGDSPFPAVSTIKGAWPTEESDSTPSSGATGTASEWFTSLDGFGNVSSGYGPRGSEFHNGIDYSVPTGTKVRTPISGTIAMLRPTNTSNGYGNAVILQDADGMYHWFCHLDKFNVKEGDKVSQNDVVGLSGNTGISTGPHLHYTISSQPRGNHSTGGDIDPDTYDYTSVGSSGSGYGLGKSKVTIKTTGSKIKNAISGLGKLTAKQAIELNPDATEPAGSAGVTAYEDLNSKDKALVRKHQQMEGHSTRGSAYNGRGIGGGFDGDYSELLAVIIKLLQKIVTNTTPISGINTIVEMLSQHFDVAIEEASKKNDSEKVTKLNQIKRKLREIQGRNATMNQGTSMGFGNSLMNNDMEYLMTAMSAIANE